MGGQNADEEAQKPVFVDLAAGQDGTIWVSRYEVLDQLDPLCPPVNRNRCMLNDSCPFREVPATCPKL